MAFHLKLANNKVTRTIVYSDEQYDSCVPEIENTRRTICDKERNIGRGEKKYLSLEIEEKLALILNSETLHNKNYEYIPLLPLLI